MILEFWWRRVSNSYKISMTLWCLLIFGNFNSNISLSHLICFCYGIITLHEITLIPNTKLENDNDVMKVNKLSRNERKKNLISFNVRYNDYRKKKGYKKCVILKTCVIMFILNFVKFIRTS